MVGNAWRYHSEITDHYFVLRGNLTITTRDPDSKRELQVGERHRITPGSAHLLSNQGA
jgi:mannose-6-phosphate isomerase-like protein (cupin superfamily)